MQNAKGNTGPKWMLGMAVIAGMLGASAVAANAAPLEFHGGYGGRYVETYVPPCPGEGYIWTAGYYNGGYWVPGAWVFRGGRGWDRGYAYGRDFHNEHEREFYGRHVDDHRQDFRGDRGHEGYRGRR